MARPRNRISLAIALCLCLIIATPLATPAADTATPAITTPKATLPPPGITGYTARSLATLSPTAARLVAAFGGTVSLAIALPGRGIVYTMNDDTRVPLASVTKLLIMLALLDQTISSPRALSDNEGMLLDAMITASDNDAADELWDDIGGNAGLRSFLTHANVTGVTLSPDDDWGDTAASGGTVAVLLARLVTGDLLDASGRARALDLMSHVIPDQHWGVTAFTGDVIPESMTVGVKNGWYPDDDDGWRVTSAGVIVPKAGGQAYTIAILTSGQPDLSSGIAAIEAITRALALAITAAPDLYPVPGVTGGNPR